MRCLLTFPSNCKKRKQKKRKAKYQDSQEHSRAENGEVTMLMAQYGSSENSKNLIPISQQTHSRN